MGWVRIGLAVNGALASGVKMAQDSGGKAVGGCSNTLNFINILRQYKDALN